MDFQCRPGQDDETKSSSPSLSARNFSTCRIVRAALDHKDIAAVDGGDGYVLVNPEWEMTRTSLEQVDCTRIIMPLLTLQLQLKKTLAFRTSRPMN